jgi:hypothetical protein
MCDQADSQSNGVPKRAPNNQRPGLQPDFFVMTLELFPYELFTVFGYAGADCGHHALPPSFAVKELVAGIAEQVHKNNEAIHEPERDIREVEDASDKPIPQDRQHERGVKLNDQHENKEHQHLLEHIASFLWNIASKAMPIANSVVIGSDAEKILESFDGLWVSLGSPYKSFDGMLKGIEFARRRDWPLLGTCAGFQYALIEFVRNVLGIAEADSPENNSGSKNIVIYPVACAKVTLPNYPVWYPRSAFGSDRICNLSTAKKKSSPKNSFATLKSIPSTNGAP